MVSKAEQHALWFVSILIESDQLEHPQVVSFTAPERVRDDKGDLIALDDNESVQQTLQAAIVRMWSKWDSDYTDDAYSDIGKVVIPTLEQKFKVDNLDWGVNVKFRRYKVNTNGEIFLSSGQFNAESGEWENCWLDEAEWLEMQGFRNGPLFHTSNEATSPDPVPASKKAAPSLDFLSAQPITGKAVKKAKK